MHEIVCREGTSPQFSVLEDSARSTLIFQTHVHPSLPDHPPAVSNVRLLTSLAISSRLKPGNIECNGTPSSPNLGADLKTRRLHDEFIDGSNVNILETDIVNKYKMTGLVCLENRVE